MHLVFKRLDREAFEAALQAWAQEELGDRAQAVAIDGKSLRGIHGEELPGVHLVALYGQQLGLTLAQKGVREKEAELSVAPELLGQVDLAGRVVTGDALYARKNLSPLSSLKELLSITGFPCHANPGLPRHHPNGP